MSTEQVILSITEGRTALGIEFGSTRIKAVLTDETTAPIAQGSHQWENRLVNNIWTYTMEDIMTGPDWRRIRDYNCYGLRLLYHDDGRRDKRMV